MGKLHYTHSLGSGCLQAVGSTRGFPSAKTKRGFPMVWEKEKEKEEKKSFTIVAFLQFIADHKLSNS